MKQRDTLTVFSRSHSLATAISRVVLCSALALPLLAIADNTTPSREYALPAGALGTALGEFAAQAGVVIYFDAAMTSGLQSPALRGRYGVEEGLANLLRGSGLRALKKEDGSYTLVKDERAEVQLAPVKVVSSGETSGLPEVYAGGQVARGARIGLLGNQDIFNTPYSVSSYTAELIEDQQARTVADVIRNDPSTHLKTSYGGIGETISVRGFSMGGNDSELYDGMPGLARRLFSSVDMLERVEVFKGANALLTGAVGAPGGVINLVPKQPLQDSLTRITTGYEYKSAGDVHLDLSRRGGAEDQFGIRINGTYNDGEGAIENSDKELQELVVALQYRVGKLQLDAILDSSKQDLDASPQQFRIVGTSAIPEAPDMSDAIQQPWETMGDKFKRGLIKARYELSDTWAVHAAYGETSYESYWLRTTGAIVNGEGDFNQTLNEYFSEEDKYSARAGIEGSFNTGPVSHKVAIDAAQFSAEGGYVFVTVSGYSVASNLYSPTFVTYPDFDPIAKETPTTYDNRVTSSAIADTLGFYDERLLVTLGIRHQRVESTSYSAATGAIIQPIYDESANTPTVGVVVKPLENLSLYGNYIEALEQGPTAPTGSENAGQVFAPLESKQVEFGIKWDLETLGLTAAIFEIEKPNGMLNADNYYGLDGEQRNRGVELSAFGEINSGLRLLSGVTYIDSEWVANATPEFDGNTVVGVPKWTAILGLEWDIPAVQGLTLSGRVNHTGSQYVLDDNSREVPSYELYSLGARYRASVGDNDVTIRANVDNLLNEEYWTTFVGLQRLLYTGAPRQLTVSATVDF